MKPNSAFNQPTFIKRLYALRRDEFEGSIKDVKCFEEVRLTKALVPWKCPFTYSLKDGTRVYEAFKVTSCPVFKVIVRLWGEYGPGRLILTAYKGQELRVKRVVDPLARVDSGLNSKKEGV